ncbi:transcriptional regulator, ArsR family [Rhodobacter ferrooxidans]|uniref:Transcriptional regulator, ArsR family n=2 Tax=Rhodobacter ferrooxidans TaxID=371731 RepID=C8S5S9_9RHOB|nr:transcriptional regulator, ArsR family [Rhodobacter sp. SW2]
MLEQAEVTTAFLRAISHPARLVILCRLAEGPANVGDLEAFTGLPQAEVSKHLARLRADGLVAAERLGRARTYALTDMRASRIMRTLYCEFCAPESDQLV